MRRLRVSLLGLLGLVMVCALAFASLRFASYWIAALLYTLVTLLLLLATVGVTYGRTGPFWRGFCVFGWGYFAFSWIGSFDYSDSSAFVSPVAGLFDGLYPLFYELPPTRPLHGIVWEAQERSDFQRVGHAMTWLTLNTLGGILSAVVFAQPQEETRRVGRTAGRPTVPARGDGGPDRREAHPTESGGEAP